MQGQKVSSSFDPILLKKIGVELFNSIVCIKIAYICDAVNILFIIMSKIFMIFGENSNKTDKSST